jgi:hypothetical protein
MGDGDISKLKGRYGVLKQCESVIIAKLFVYPHTCLKVAKTRRSPSHFRSRCASNTSTTHSTATQDESQYRLVSVHQSPSLWCHHSLSLRCLSPASSLELAQVFLFLPTRNRSVRSHSSAMQDLLTVHRRSTSLMSLALSYQSDNRQASSSHARQPPALLCSTAVSDTNQDHAGCRSSLGRSLVQHGQAEPNGP